MESGGNVAYSGVMEKRSYVMNDSDVVLCLAVPCGWFDFSSRAGLVQ